MRNLIIGVALAALSVPAMAQAPCGPVDAVRSMLESKYGEQGFAEAVTGQYRVEIWTNADTGSWTVVVIRTDGIACVRMAGQHFGPMAAPEGDAS